MLHKYTYNLENNFKLDMTNLKSGIYFMNFEAEEGTITKRIIKL
ncbi:T9SS type A sorting domain-containing protein [Croceibacter atlanticus]